jgi:light-regulated signal transduction histidine kinase (bacteriophytochrome)
MFSQMPVLEKIKVSRTFPGVLLLLLTLLVFYLDLITGEKVTFYAFYIPSIMLMAWFFGRTAGWLMVALVMIMWIIAQWRMRELDGHFIYFWNVVVRLITFSVVCALTFGIRIRQEQLEAKSRELARSNRELEQFAAKAAHDLQSPLATILGYSELIREKHQKTGDEETKGFADHVIQGVKRMSGFIKALLNYSIVSKPDIPVVPVDLDKIVKEVVEDLHFRIVEKKAVITSDPMPQVAINAGLAGLLFQNLIGNAMKYCEQEPRIQVSAVRRGKEWLFSIKDNGIGIPEESRERVFIMFEKLATRQKYPGSGIGLATCQKIVERYGGRIWVESKVGEGSTFFFTLPA